MSVNMRTPSPGAPYSASPVHMINPSPPPPAQGLPNQRFNDVPLPPAHQRANTVSSVSSSSSSQRRPVARSGTSASQTIRVSDGSDSDASDVGLAYADGTDDESDSSAKPAGGRKSPARSVAATGSMERSRSIASATRKVHIRDPSLASTYSSTSTSEAGLGYARSRSQSVSTAGSAGRPVVASPPPPIPPLKPRQRTLSNASSGSESAYSSSSLKDRETMFGASMAMEKLLSDLGKASVEEPVRVRDRSGTGSSLASSGDRDREQRVVFGGPHGRTQRSNTVQVPHSPPEATKPVKLPTRSLTTAYGASSSSIGSSSSSSSSGSSRVGGGSLKKTRVCLKCTKVVEDGRWVRADNIPGKTAGSPGVLCETCWKNIYLPKCVRCDKVIERAAVSSSDGQLVGKYHRECFNCDRCHVRFSQSSFLVGSLMCF